MNNVRVVFYTIIDPTGNDGTSGGPQTALNIINNIESLGFSVSICTPRVEFKDPNESAFNVYHDIFNDPIGSYWFSIDDQSSLLNSKTPYIFSECAYTGCTTKPYGDDIYEINPLSNLTRQFLINAKVSMFASPLHRDEFERFMNQPIENSFLYAREIDTSKFNNLGANRDIEYFTVGAINHWKGTDLVVAQYKDQGLHVAGYGSTTLKDVVYLGRVPHDELPEIYNRTKNFVHFPRCKEAFGRTVAEAALCGCNIIGNENVGALSFGKDLSDPSFYSDSKNSFLQMIKDNFS